jgi:hypothetical protein
MRGGMWGLMITALLLMMLSIGVVAQVSVAGFTAVAGSTFNFAPASVVDLPGYHAGAFQSSLGTQSVANNTSTPLTFDMNEYDTSGIHSTSVNPSRFTVPSGLGGTWLATCQVQIEQAGTPGLVMALSINVNGSPVNNQVTTPTSNEFSPTMTLSVPLLMNAGDYMECIVFQGSGGTLTTTEATTNGALFRMAF